MRVQGPTGAGGGGGRGRAGQPNLEDSLANLRPDPQAVWPVPQELLV